MARGHFVRAALAQSICPLCIFLNTSNDSLSQQFTLGCERGCAKPALVCSLDLHLLVGLQSCGVLRRIHARVNSGLPHADEAFHVGAGCV